MKLPPPEDPGWKGFGALHSRFLKRHPDFEEQMAEEFRLAASLREHPTEHDIDSSGGEWLYVSEQHAVEIPRDVFEWTGPYLVATPHGHLTLTVSAVRDRALKFTWQGNPNNRYDILAIFLAADSLLPLNEPRFLGRASVDGKAEFAVAELSFDPSRTSWMLCIALVAAEECDSNFIDRPSTLYLENNVIPSFRHQIEDKDDYGIVGPPGKVILILDYKKTVLTSRTHLNHEGIRRIELDQKVAAAGVADFFPDEQTLPPEWFPGYEVKLHFSDEGGLWQVRRTGTFQELILEFWSSSGALLGAPVLVGDDFEPIPVAGPSEVARIYISTKDHE